MHFFARDRVKNTSRMSSTYYCHGQKVVSPTQTSKWLVHAIYVLSYFKSNLRRYAKLFNVTTMLAHLQVLEIVAEKVRKQFHCKEPNMGRRSGRLP